MVSVGRPNLAAGSFEVNLHHKPFRSLRPVRYRPLFLPPWHGRQPRHHEQAKVFRPVAQTLPEAPFTFVRRR